MYKSPARYGLWITLLLCLTGYQVFAQTSYTNLTTENGLSSNNVYFLLKDTYGYLWMATEKGVIRYNGYTMKKFGLPEGLNTDDVWYMYEDSRHRLWLATLGNEIGYLYKDSYHAPYIKTQHNFLRPGNFYESGGCFVFSSTVSISGDLYFEHNDSFRRYHDPYKDRGSLMYMRSGLVRISNEGMYIMRPNDLHFRKMPGYKFLSVFNDNLNFHPFSDFIISYKTNGGKVSAYNTTRQQVRSLIVSTHPNENIYTTYPRDSTFYFVTPDHIFCVNAHMDITRVYTTDSILTRSTGSEDLCVNILEDPFWNLCFSTRQHGVYLTNPSHIFHPVNVRSGDASLHYAGQLNDTTHFWYNSATGGLYVMSDDMRCRRVYMLKKDGLANIIPVNKDTAILAKRRELYYITGIGMLPYKKSIVHITDVQGIPRQLSPDLPEFSYGAIQQQNRLYFICNNLGFCSLTYSGDTDRMYQLWNRKLNSFAFDPQRQAFWATSNNEILVYPLNGAQLVIDRNTLRQAGIKKIEQVLADTGSGNIYLKDYQYLFCYNCKQRTVTPVLTHYNMEGAVVRLSRNRLIAAGRFGLVISGTQKPDSAYQYYPNIRNSAYNILYEMQVAQRYIILKTDKGFFTVATDQRAAPADIAYSNIKLLIKYDDSLCPVRTQDTLQLHQRDLSLQFDAINPNGTGSIRYRYMIPELFDDWKTLDNNEVYFRDLKPGKYYTLMVTVSDDIMTSELYSIKLLVVPKWWQTTLGNVILGFAALLGLAALAGLAAFISGRNARRRNVRRNMELQLKSLRLETELKSIYAQINPHFIFNTLSTTAYFIKKNNAREANRHIVAFSKLLRSYIHSSRNKFIPLETEIENIGNYILLQQARFEERFSYHLHVDERIDTSQLKIPALLLQPLIENAINHGLLHKNGNGSLNISFTTNETMNELYCTIDDDGIGRAASRQYKEENDIKTTSYGSALIADLISVLNTYHELAVSIEYTDKTLPQTGTIVKLTIKYNQ